MTANHFAALLDGVRRYSYHDYDEDDGFCLREKDVLAALAADVPDDLAEAGKVLEGVTPGPWVMDSGDVFSDGEDFPLAMCLASRPANARFIAWCREGVPALIARIAAMEARIATMIDPATVQKMLEDAQPIMAEACRGYDEALAAERAKVAKLVEALVEHNDILRSAFEIAKREGVKGEIASTNWDAYYNRVAVVLNRHHQTANAARAAIVEASQ